MVAGVAVCWLQVVRNLVCVFGSASMLLLVNGNGRMVWFSLM